MPNKLETMDAKTLMTTPMEPLKFVVSGLIPEGLHVLAGSPKIGKSWLALWICLQVAKGEKVWGFETLKSEVLYLCLEDSFARIQSRLFEITDEASSTLHFAVMSDAILLVHHLRKTGDVDPLNMISGTSGIAGGADTNFVLQKDKLTENTATLICTGRDIEGREFTLLYDGNDDMTVESSPINLPSLPSSPSQDSNFAAVTPYSPLCSKIDGGVA